MCPLLQKSLGGFPWRLYYNSILVFVWFRFIICVVSSSCVCVVSPRCVCVVSSRCVCVVSPRCLCVVSSGCLRMCENVRLACYFLSHHFTPPIPTVSTKVLNVDFPPNASSYTHRIGRTARGGANGTALSLVLVKDEGECRTLEEVQV